MSSIYLKKLKLPNPGITPIGVNEVDEFHQNTKSTVERDYHNVGNAYQYLFEYRGRMETASNRKNYFTKPSISLPKTKVADMAFDRILEKRKSMRNFSNIRCSLETVSKLLSSCKATREGVVSKDVVLRFRPYPSPGALYPSEIYVALVGVEGQSPSICHFDPIGFRLTPVQDFQDIDADRFWSAVGADRNEEVKNCSVCIVITSLFERTIAKYGPLGYRFALLESGIVLQQLILSATACELGSLPWAGYFDDELNELINVDGITETVTNCLFVGRC